MKKFLAVALIALAVTVFIPTTARAEMQYQNIPLSQAFNSSYGIPVGNWYDADGDLILKIGSDGTINNYRILSVGFTGDSVAFYKLTVSKGNDSGVVYLMHFGNGYHDTLVLNEDTPLRHSRQPQYVESIGGVYLGMSKNQLVSLYGQPSVIGEVGRNKAWTYNREGFRVTFDRPTATVITSITIFPGGNRRFDGSGLSARDSLQSFINRYNATSYGRRMYSIGHGEGFYQSDDGITLFALESY